MDVCTSTHVDGYSVPFSLSLTSNTSSPTSFSANEDASDFTEENKSNSQQMSIPSHNHTNSPTSISSHLFCLLFYYYEKKVWDSACTLDSKPLTRYHLRHFPFSLLHQWLLILYYFVLTNIQVSRTMEVLRFYSTCKSQTSMPQFHGCWLKLQDSWVRDKGLYYWQQQ